MECLYSSKIETRDSQNISLLLVEKHLHQFRQSLWLGREKAENTPEYVAMSAASSHASDVTAVNGDDYAIVRASNFRIDLHSIPSLPVRSVFSTACVRETLMTVEDSSTAHSLLSSLGPNAIDSRCTKTCCVRRPAILDPSKKTRLMAYSVDHPRLNCQP